jgi:hypothetical protein
MPSAFETLFAANLSGLYEQFGLAATYTAPNAAETAGITVRVDRGDFLQVPGDMKAGGQLQTGKVLVRQSELSKPVKGGRFTFEGAEVWTVETTPTLQNGEFICTCTRGGTDRLMDRRAKDA